jgi:NAD(P)-dependent dehydrogenase (short-subunit alcohol dehydrogenase family)
MKNLFSLKNKVIILTGGAGYLGQHYARGLKAVGAKVLLWDKRGGQGIMAVDITNEAEVNQAVQLVVKKYRRIDVLINNAAMNPGVEGTSSQDQFVPYEDYPLDLWERELKVNLTGTMLVTKAVAKIMMKQKSGSIINIGSDAAVVAHDHRVYNDPQNRKYKSIAYSTTKTGLVGFTRQWAPRLAQFNVRINTFSPTGTSAPNQPIDFIARYSAGNMFGRMPDPAEYFGPLIFLCSEASSFMTGQNLIVDGGKTVW